LTEDFVYKEVLLEFIEVEEPKSRENIGRILLELLYKLDIEYKLLSICKTLQYSGHLVGYWAGRFLDRHVGNVVT
jgi:hypothetical protein